MAWTKTEVSALSMNPFTKIKDQWMLVSAGKEGAWNTMTANWGGVGELWFRPVATTYIRHSRYTKEFVDNNDYFTLTFLKDGHKEALNVLGSKSGREIDKMSGCGLTPCFVDGQPTFAEAELVLICRKVFVQDLDVKNLCDKEIITRCYADNDYHTMYIGEIVACYQNN